MDKQRRRLEGVRVAVLAADGFEQVEVIAPVRALKRAGADVRVISLRPGRIRGANFIGRGGKVPVDDTVFNAQPEDYSALFLPGGFVNPDLLRQSERARHFVQRMDQLGRPIATLCHGPETLISAGLVRGKRITSWPGIADDLRNAGANWVDEKVVREGNWVSSRSPEDLPDFVPAMLDLFAERAPQMTTKLRRPVRWLAWASRAASVGALAGAVVGGRAAYQSLSTVMIRRARSRAFAQMARDLGLATIFGGTLFAKLALEPSVRALSSRQERGKLLATTWRRFALPGGLALATATGGWLAERAQAPRWRRPTMARNLMLTGVVITGLLNFLSGELFGRFARKGRAPIDTGRWPRALPKPAARWLRTGTVTGLAHTGLLAGLIGSSAAARANGR
jgi:protease I